MRVAIVGGAGGVGASTAFNLALQRTPRELVLLDSRPEMITSHAMDLEQVLEQSPGCSIREGDAADLPGADIVVLISATPLLVDTPRVEYLGRNALIADELAAALPAGWGGLLIVVTNPVDPLVTRLQARTGLDRRRIVGYTLNDSLRMRTGVANALGVGPGRVESWVVGEHGDLSVPLYGRVTVDGQPVQLTAAQQAAAEEYQRTWYTRHVALDSGRSSTWTSGLGVARMVAALDGDGGLWPSSVVLQGEYGVHGVAVSVPVTLGRGGAEEIHEWAITDAERTALHASAEFVRAAAASIPG
jgi:malate/lactate dehydrogenase